MPCPIKIHYIAHSITFTTKFLIKFDSRAKNFFFHFGNKVSTVLGRTRTQECIPVGCVPPAAVAIGGRGPGPDPPQLPPWVWA